MLATSYVRAGQDDGGDGELGEGQRRRSSSTIDWKALGLDPAKATITAPAIDKFQEARTFAASEPIPVEPGKGWLLVIQ